MKQEFFLTQTLAVSCLFMPVSILYLRHFKGFRDFPGGTDGKEPPASVVDLISSRFDPWVGKIAWRSAWQPTPVFLPGESPRTEEPGGLQSIGSQRVGHD